MKILLIADQESRYIWDFFDPKRFENIDVILSAGDLKASYMEFINTVIRKPLYYIHGNHDHHYLDTPPMGCINIEDNLIVVDGVRILGLGGSMRYKKGPMQYSEKEMVARVRRLRRKIDKHQGFDILLTHAPAKGIGDGDDLCHQGFMVFNQLIDTYKPSYFLHGHQHLNYNLNAKRIHQYDLTTIINGYDYYIFDFKPNGYSYDKKNGPKPDFDTGLWFRKIFSSKKQ
jgi:Icc-related predicted phosphoesterase